MSKNIIDKINKLSGKRNAFSGDDDSVAKVDVIPTDILPLDFALGCGGIPRGKVTDIYGLESAGKSSLCYMLISSAQKLGLKCALIDAEYSYKPDHVQRFGVDISKLLIIQPDCFEEGADVIEELIEDKYGLIVVDSVSSLLPRSEAESGHGKSPMAIQARLMSQMLRKQMARISKKKTALVCINQMRANLMAMNPYDRYTVTGGFALRFYSSIRIQISKKTSLKTKDGKLAGYIVNFQIKKNKIARPGSTCEVPYLFENGFAKEGDVASMAIDKGIFKQEGSWIFHGETKWHGKDKANAEIQNNSKLKDEILSQIFPQTQQ
jgi:recombination protein RecA